MADIAKLFNSLPPEAQQEMLNSAALPPPPPLQSNFDNPPNQNGIAHAALIVCIVACVLFVPLAVYTKVVRTKILRMEDVFAAIAVASWCVFVGFLYEAVRNHGYFIHQWDFRLGQAVNYLRYFWVVTLAYFVTIGFIKIAIVFQWIHLFVPRETRNGFWWICQIIGWLNWAAAIIMMFLVAFGCKPIAKFYNPLLEGKCVDTIPTIYIAPSINLVFDTIALILPQKVIWGLQLSWQKRLGVSFLFALGLLACISAALRIPASVKFTRSDDRTYNIASTELWCLAEMTAGILIYCMPSAPAAVKRAKDVAKTSTQRLRGGSSAASQKASNSKSSSGHRTTGHRSIPGSYREIDEIPLTDVKPSTTASFHDMENGLDGSEHGITRTTHITMTSATRSVK